MALPPNLAGVALPRPAIDPQLNDGNIPGHPATAHEVDTLAESYESALVLSSAAPGQITAEPPWLHNLHLQFANMNQQFTNMNQQLANIANDVAAMRNEWPILLMNRQAGNHEQLYNPTISGWVLLAPPHPTTRDELSVFTQAQCIASAGALGLPPLPQNAPVDTHRRQIAVKLGVTLSDNLSS